MHFKIKGSNIYLFFNLLRVIIALEVIRDLFFSSSVTLGEKNKHQKQHLVSFCFTAQQWSKPTKTPNQRHVVQLAKTLHNKNIMNLKKHLNKLKRIKVKRKSTEMQTEFKSNHIMWKYLAQEFDKWCGKQ